MTAADSVGGSWARARSGDEPSAGRDQADPRLLVGQGAAPLASSACCSGRSPASRRCAGVSSATWSWRCRRRCASLGRARCTGPARSGRAHPTAGSRTSADASAGRTCYWAVLPRLHRWRTAPPAVDHHVDPVPAPSWADAGSLGSYPFLGAAMVVRARAELGTPRHRSVARRPDGPAGCGDGRVHAGPAGRAGAAVRLPRGAGRQRRLPGRGSAAVLRGLRRDRAAQRATGAQVVVVAGYWDAGVRRG